jgi:hypothetical protein
MLPNRRNVACGAAKRHDYHISRVWTVSSRGESDWLPARFFGYRVLPGVSRDLLPSAFLNKKLPPRHYDLSLRFHSF